jgi:polyisoprenoid-binding protein YceI
MQRKILPILAMLLALVLAACAQTDAPVQPAAASTPIPATEPMVEATATPEAETEEATTTPAAEEVATPIPAGESEPAAAETGARIFTLAPDRSEVRFVIDEILRGAPKTVIGANSQVTGQVLVDPANPANTGIGAISIDAGSFVTDDNNRNNAIRRFILQPAQYPVVSFVPTETSALPASAAAGDSFDFQVTGDLTILNRTNPVTFDLTATVLSADEIQITGATAINRADFGISIPSVPFVANVGESLALELDLVAVAAE